LAQPAKNPSSTQPRQRAISRSHPRSISAALYFIRILILGLGVGVLAGTLLSVRDPASRLNQDQQADQKSIESGNRATGQMPNLVQEITPLKAALQALAAKTPELTPGIFVVDLDGNAYVDINGSQSLPAASTIKVPILIAFFQDVDAGKIRLDELLTLRADLVAKEAGDMQYQPLGTRYTALETAYKMITISDNTATNLLIARIGEGDPKRGMEILNQRFKSWGLTGTTLNNLLPDLGGTNLTSARDLSLLMTRISQGDLVSLRSRDRLLSIMRATENDSLLPQGLGKGATIAHKTGGIASVLGDVGLVDLPNGKLYTIAVLAKRPPNSEQAYDLIQQTSRLVYQYLVRPPVSSRPNATPPKTSPSDQASPEADENRTSNPSSSDP
jgi:beta-lactamase class A